MIKLRAGWLSVRCRDYEEAKRFSYHWRVGCLNKGGVFFRTIYGEIFISASYFLGFKLFHFCSPKIKPGPNWPVSAAVTGTYHDAVFWCFINVSNWWCIWSHYSAFAITPCFGDKSVNCWFTAVRFGTRKQLLEKNKFHAPLPPRFGISSMKSHCCHVRGEKYPARGRGKAWKSGISHSGPKWELNYLENAVKWRSSSWGRRFCLRRSRDIRLGGHSILWTSNAVFCHPWTKLLWPARGMGEGFTLSDLKLVLTDIIRIHLIALGVLGESAWKNI